jgi:mannose-6-phosphate isomerase-like protein (cupin superfamily)
MSDFASLNLPDKLFTQKYFPSYNKGITLFILKEDTILKNNCCITDCGAKPFVTDVCSAARKNCNYRTALWTGNHLQMTLMCIPAGGDIGLEVHHDTDQCLLVECGSGKAVMGESENCLNFCCPVCENTCVFVPAGTWHNIINTGCTPLKIVSTYAPPHHPHGTVHRTKCDAEEYEHK